MGNTTWSFQRNKSQCIAGIDFSLCYIKANTLNEWVCRDGWVGWGQSVLVVLGWCCAWVSGGGPWCYGGIVEFLNGETESSSHPANLPTLEQQFILINCHQCRAQHSATHITAIHLIISLIMSHLRSTTTQLSSSHSTVHIYHSKLLQHHQCNWNKQTNKQINANIERNNYHMLELIRVSCFSCNGWKKYLYKNVWKLIFVQKCVSRVHFWAGLR